MKPLDLDSITSNTKFCTRNGFDAKVMSFNDKTYNSANCKRPIKYKVFYNDGTSIILYCDKRGHCNSNKFINVETTHDLMIKD